MLTGPEARRTAHHPTPGGSTYKAAGSVMQVVICRAVVEALRKEHVVPALWPRTKTKYTLLSRRAMLARRKGAI